LDIFRFARDEKVVDQFGSAGVRATRIAAGAGPVRLTCLTVDPGGVIGMHPATETQLFLVVGGDGWATGPDAARIPLTAGWGVRWEAGEDHMSGTDTGLTAIAIEGTSLHVFAPDRP
jgi:hypothetical protein